METLEERRVLAAVTVDIASDKVDVDLNAINISTITSPGGAGLDGKISLREAIAAANNTQFADSIGFAPSLNGATITLGEDEQGIPTGAFTQLNITDALTIDASMLTSGLTIDGNDPSASNRTGIRIFNITNAAGTVTIDGLTLTGADPSDAVTRGSQVHAR